MGRVIGALIVALVLACSGIAAVSAHAETFATRPLVVVRFNQQRVYFDQQLYNAVSQAVAIKPDVVFDLVSNAPVTGDPNVDARWVSIASRNTQAVVATMQRIGVPMERMRVTGQTQAGLRYDETHVYVR